MKKLVAAVFGGVMAVSTLTACGGSDDFCSQAEDIIGGEAANAQDPAKMQELADAAPDEIKDDFQVVADGLKAVESGDMEALQNIDQAALQEAGANIEKWGQENCQ